MFDIAESPWRVWDCGQSL